MSHSILVHLSSGALRRAATIVGAGPSAASRDSHTWTRRARAGKTRASLAWN
ncbi:MAG TPA: hypothetical protein VGN54_05385 [Mycobacteriales bacterium]|nr:hypothetical protein [Mycobacteriales bacterium]